jgi:hypothetical protein
MDRTPRSQRWHRCCSAGVIREFRVVALPQGATL